MYTIPPEGPQILIPEFYSLVRLASSSEQQTMIRSGSWRPGCPLPLSDLRIIELSYWGFDHHVHTGKLAVNRTVATQVVTVFESLFSTHYPIHQLRLVDDFQANDETSMLADNTSGYNCRRSPLDGSWSRHAYGLAIDINPLENPEVIDTRAVDPPVSKAFVNRNLQLTGMVQPNDPAVTAFAAIGWQWGGTWPSGWQDWQHFYLPLSTTFRE